MPSNKNPVSKLNRNSWKDRYPSNWSETYKKDLEDRGNRCSVCGTGNSRENPLQRDHVIPLSKGGNNSPMNLRILCHSCHTTRHKVKVYKRRYHYE